MIAGQEVSGFYLDCAFEFIPVHVEGQPDLVKPLSVGILYFVEAVY